MELGMQFFASFPSPVFNSLRMGLLFEPISVLNTPLVQEAPEEGFENSVTYADDIARMPPNGRDGLVYLQSAEQLELNRWLL